MHVHHICLIISPLPTPEFSALRCNYVGYIIRILKLYILYSKEVLYWNTGHNIGGWGGGGGGGEEGE